MRNLREGCLVELDIKYRGGLLVPIFQSIEFAILRDIGLHTAPYLLVKKIPRKQTSSDGSQPAFEDLFDCLVLAGERLLVVRSYALQEYKEYESI